MPPALDTTLRTLLAIAIAAAGGLAAHLAGLPAGWVMGGAVAVAIASLAGLRLAFPDWLRDATFVAAGLSMGANVARESLTLIAQWPITMAALALELLLVISVTGYLLRRLFRLDRGTAYLSSFPGQLGIVMSIAAAGVGDPRQIVIIQVLRILLLTVCVPIGALFVPVGHFDGPPPAGDIEPLALLGVALACAVTGYVFTRLRAPAGYALGAMAAAITAKFAGLFDGAMPGWLLDGIFVFVGALIGSRFVGIGLDEFRRAVAGGVAGTFFTVVLVTLVAWGASLLVDLPFGQIWLGLAPGALEGMGALGLALGYDPAFIAAHHVVRLLLLAVAIPLVAMLVRGRDARP